MSATMPQVGEALPALDSGTITRHRIALYAHGSGDLNPIHVDPDFARDQAGLPDVIVHGMYSMGLFGRLLTGWAGPNSVRSLDTRFEAMLPVKESLRCEGVVDRVEPADGGALVSVKLSARKRDGTGIASGSAVVFVAATQ